MTRNDVGTTTWTSKIAALGPRLAEGAAARDANDTFAEEPLADLREQGFASMLVPTELGGGGASHATTCAALRALARYDASTALTLSMHLHLIAAQVVQHRSGHERAAALLRSVAKERLFLVSTGARDWLESNGTMARVDGGWQARARKAFASGGPAGDLVVTSAPYAHPTEGEQVLHFAVPLRADGVRIDADWEAHGMRGTGSHTLHLEGVRVPDEAITLVRPRGVYHPIWSVVLTVALPLIAAVYVGIADRAVEIARERAVRRRDAVEVQWAVGEMDGAQIRAETLHDAMVDLARNLDFEPSLEGTNRMLVLKTSTIEAAREAVEAAFEAAGGAAYFRRTGLERLLRDVRAGDFHPLPRKAQTRFTGRLGLGLAPA